MNAQAGDAHEGAEPASAEEYSGRLLPPFAASLSSSSSVGGNSKKVGRSATSRDQHRLMRRDSVGAVQCPAVQAAGSSLPHPRQPGWKQGKFGSRLHVGPLVVWLVFEHFGGHPSCEREK